MDPRSGPVSNGLARLERAECIELLAGRPVGRLVFTQGALPDVLPVNYLLDGDHLLIRLNSSSVAATATRDAVVAFEVDDIDIAARAGWSVTVVGRAHEITEPTELRRAQSLQLTPWVGEAHDHFVSIAVEKVTGRRLFQPDRAVDVAVGSYPDDHLDLVARVDPLLGSNLEIN